MAENTVTFDTSPTPITVPSGTLIAEAAVLVGLNINQPCGGQGRCGRCAVQVKQGNVRCRSTLRLSAESIADGYVQACQSVIESDVSIVVPPQEKVERNLTSDRTASTVTVPSDFSTDQQSIQRINLTLTPPSLDDQTDDWSRFLLALRQQASINSIDISLKQLQKLGTTLREKDWQVTAVVDKPLNTDSRKSRLIDLTPGKTPGDTPLLGAAVDIGTTTVTVWLVNLITGEVLAQVAEYNGQITRGEDVISRIIYASKNDSNAKELQNLVTSTINQLLETACKRTQSLPEDIMKVAITGNSTMMHLLLGIPASSIRLMPFVTAINTIPPLTASDISLNINPNATIDCLPGIASYVGADITTGVLSSGQDDTEATTLFIDVGTNGEIVLGNNSWLVTCACSAGPAFEGAGVRYGMRATRGAIEEIWISNETLEPSFRVIGNTRPRGLCGSGLIALLSEMFLTGIIDKGGNFNKTLPTDRIRDGENGPEYVIAWSSESASGEDIAITRVDIDNLLRAKAAIYAGFTVLAEKIGIPLEAAEQILVGGAFGKYINIEKAVEIGLLPDKPWEYFQFLGNTAIKGTYLALLNHQQRERIDDIASRMTYIELSADNSFYDAFTSALFLPHTDISLFPTVQAALTLSKVKE